MCSDMPRVLFSLWFDLVTFLEMHRPLQAGRSFSVQRVLSHIPLPAFIGTLSSAPDCCVSWEARQSNHTNLLVMVVDEKQFRVTLCLSLLQLARAEH